jgi:hypothetical protein
MQDDFTVFWLNNERAYALFYDLLDRSERGAYDDDFLAQLAAYREAAPESERADIFAAKYLLHHGDAENAAVCGERAHRKRPVNYEIWKLLSHAYAACGRYADALVMQGYALNFFKVPITLDVPASVLTEETLARLSRAAGKANYAPYALSRMNYSAEEGLTAQSTVFFEEFLPVSEHITPHYYVGAYTERDMHGTKRWLMRTIAHAEGLADHVGGDFTFDIMRGTRVPKSATIRLEDGVEAIVPIFGTAEGQVLTAKTETVDDCIWLNPGAPNYFRLNEDTTLSSTEEFIVGTSIPLVHSPARKKLVLNILVDALPWQVLRTSFAEHMPNTARFFAHGTIFDQHFSVFEYTYPSLATIETGMYPQHTGIFSEWVAIELNEDIITIAERARDAGYATSNLMSDGSGIYNGVTRGYDRLIVSSYDLKAYEAVERVVHYLDGCGEADHFIFLHLGDVHPWGSTSFQIPTATQMHLPLAQRLSDSKVKVTSPYLRPSAFNQTAFWQGVHDADRALGMLFSYLEQHYAPEDYLISLYSDHGVPIFSPTHYIVDAQMTRATWMMRGAGVPEGVVASELTSAVDIYPTLAHLLNFPVDAAVDGVLPRLFGGTGREIAYSNSLFPRKYYYLAARAQDYTLFLETLDPVSLSGTADLARTKVGVYPRAHENIAEYEVDSPELRAFFYPRVREFLQGIGSNGEQFPPPEEIV